MPPQTLDKSFSKYLGKAQSVIDGTRIKTRATDHFAVEICDTQLDGKNYAAMGKTYQPKLDGGYGRIAVPRGKTYGIRLLNYDPDYEAAVFVHVDGLSIFRTAEDKRFLDSFFIVPKAQSATEPGSFDVIGWFVSVDDSRLFLCGTLKDTKGYSDAELARFKNVLLDGRKNEYRGQIVVSYAKAWVSGQKAPPEEAQVASEPAAGDGQTVPGAKAATQYKTEHRYTGQSFGTIVVRYLD
jgi:hypothetical protein